MSPQNGKDLSKRTDTTYLLRQMLLAANTKTIIEKPLLERAELVKLVAAKNKLPLTVLGSRPLFGDVELITTTKPAWALYNLSRDPLWTNGRFPVPAKCIERLEKMLEIGIEFDALYIAHELPGEFQPDRDSLGIDIISPPPPLVAVRLSENLGKITNGILQTYLAILGKPLRALSSASMKANAILRDPILMGTIVPPNFNPEPGVPAIWFFLAAWRW